MIISAGFDSALGDTVGGVGVTPVGFAYMTWVLKKICKRTLVVLEGGYDLNALEVSSEAVVKTLQINSDDTESFDKYLQELSGDPLTSLSQIETEALLNPRPSFKQTASNLAKLLQKQWSNLSHLIFEKPRKGSNRSSGSKSNSSFAGIGDFNADCSTPARLEQKLRSMSMQEELDNLQASGGTPPQYRQRADSYRVEAIPEDLEK